MNKVVRMFFLVCILSTFLLECLQFASLQQGSIWGDLKGVIYLVDIYFYFYKWNQKVVKEFTLQSNH